MPEAVTTIAALCRALPGALLPVVPDEPDTSTRAVHISELVDPTDYLDGGELLLTTGMAMPLTPSGCRAYVARLRERGVAALALGLGPVHHEVPGVLTRACDRMGLPLLVVPDAVPFQRVTRAFWAIAGGTQERELQDALRSQQRLVTAAAAPAAVAGILLQLARAVGGHAVATDARGRPRMASSPDWPYDPAELQHAVERVRLAGPRTAATFPLGDLYAVIHPVVCDGDVVSYLAVATRGRPNAHTRSLVLMTLALLGMEAAHRRISRSGDVAARAAVAHLVDRGRAAAVPDLAEHLGLDAPPERVRVLAAQGPAPAVLDTLVAVLGVPARWWGTTAEHGAWLMLPSRVPEPAAAVVTAALADLGSTAAVVIGPVVPLPEVHAVRTLLEVRARTITPGTAQTWRPDERIPLVTREWAEAVLAPLRTEGNSLLTTLAAYLRNRGSWQRTAVELGLHRNSVRAHIARAEQVLGADLGDPDTVARLWIALRETTVLPTVAGSATGPAGRHGAGSGG